MSFARPLRAALLAAAASLLVAAAPAAAVTFSSPQFVYKPSGSQFYSYAPSSIAANGREYHYTCHNFASGYVKDDIYLTQVSGGSVQSSSSVLGGSASGWDSFHVCDPSVVRSRFTYNGTTYAYGMFYLGNDQNCSCHNQIGVAFSNSLTGPWVKYPSPLVTFDMPSTAQWGVGQPSVTTVDGNTGRVLLFYTRNTGANETASTFSGSTIKAYRRDLTLGNMSSPQIGPAVEVTTSGLKNLDGSNDFFLNNFDVAYDGSRDRFYAVREGHPYPTSTSPWYLANHVQVVSIAGSSIWNGGGTWQVEGNIGTGLTGFARNHNAGLLRNEYGGLAASNRLDVIFTRADPDPDSLWTYALYRSGGTLP